MPKYTAQFRTLFFALRKNREAALQVLRGAITPAALVRMSKGALADSQAIKLRQAVLEKSRRMAVLDDEAAAQFSTAANHALRQRELQVLASCCDDLSSSTNHMAVSCTLKGQELLSNGLC